MRRTIVTTLIFTISVITAYTQDSIFYKPNECADVYTVIINVQLLQKCELF